ncbi:MAG: restriction endonuclease subunit S [Marinisporobacter sp.]|jgi:type I restriction enzyme S subunit|nr:restriction endonuclease subunit S [Marinisporobacter sp.]
MKWIKLKELNEYKAKSINPLKEPDTIFEMYSVPSYTGRFPEIAIGSEIGSSKQIVQKGDVLLCKINPRINRVWEVSQFTDHQSIASSEWIVIRNKDMFSKYLLWYFRCEYFRTLMTSNITGMGGSLMRAQPKQVGKYLVPVPEYDIQVKIANVLDKAQFLIDKRKEQIEACDELIKSVFYEMFGDPIRNDKHWEVRKLSHLGKFIGGGTPSRKIAEYFKGYIPWITTVSLQGKIINEDSAIEFITKDAVLNSSTKIIPIGSVMIGTRVGVGKTAINICEMCTNQDIMSLTGVSKEIDKQFLMFVLKGYEEYFNDKKRGATIQGITGQTLKEINIILPPLNLQNKFATQVQKIEQQKHLFKKSLTELETNFNALMQRAFKGELF